MFLPPTTALGAGLYSIALYGGLVSQLFTKTAKNLRVLMFFLIF